MKNIEFKIGQMLRWKDYEPYSDYPTLDYGIIFDKYLDEETKCEYINVCWRLPTEDGDTIVKYKSKELIRVMDRDGEKSAWSIVE
jgi:hypothetical protein